MSDFEQVYEKLRDCQKQAVDAVSKYIEHGAKNKSCLVAMPTGSGKTGVIAASCLLKSNKRCLVLCNRFAVKEQLIEQLDGGFFHDVLDVELDAPLGAEELIDTAEEEVIYVATFQRLVGLKEEDRKALYDKFDLIVIDEGHAEPAPQWSDISRNFDAHTVIITATPYRNDLFQFSIDLDHPYIYSFGEAVENDDIVDPLFHEIDEFDGVVGFLKEGLADQPGIKCIIKCKSFEEVERYRKMLSGVFDVSAYHDNYKGERRAEKTSVKIPKDLKERPYEVVVHQKKLDEGVDVPQAKILVLTYPVASGRELVQSVGRVVRRHSGYKAHVIDMAGGSNVKVWENYKKFDAYLGVDNNKKRFVRSLDTANLLRSYVEEFPEYSYFGSSFRKRVDFNEIKPSDDINIPRVSVCFIEKGEGFSVQSFCDSLALRAFREGELVRVVDDSESLYVVMYIAFKNSPFLNNGFFFEPSLEVTVVKESNGLVAVFDSRSIDYSEDDELCTLASVQADKIHSLSGRTPYPRTEEVHTRVIGSTRRRPESTSYRDQNLERVPHSQANSNSAITRMVVANLNQDEDVESRYYIGSRSGRVADQKRRNLSLREFEVWVDDISSWINKGSACQSSFVNSYAKPVNTVPKGKAISVVFDFSFLGADGLVHSARKKEVVGSGFVYAKVTADEVCVGKNKKVGLKIGNFEDNVLSFESDECWYFNDESGEKRELVKAINSDQSFKVIFEGGFTYLGGQTYRHSLPTEKGFDLSQTKLGKCFVGLPELQKEGLKEKGRLVNADAFSSQSLFGIVDSIKEHADKTKTPQQMGPFYDYLHNPDIVICTDMGTEPADFIVASKDKICFVHVKCGNSEHAPKSAAGGLAEVAAQAIKNIEHMISKNKALLPGNMGHLKKAWKTEESGGSLTHRVRLIFGEDAAAFKSSQKINDDNEMMKMALEEIKERRSSDAVDKEIWIVAGNAFSRKAFFKNMMKGSAASSESLQAYQLIDSWYTTASSHDIGIKFFVSP